MKYKIKVGRHYHNKVLMRIWEKMGLRRSRKSIKRRFMFTESCWYPDVYVEESGYNKLFGGGDVNHHNNSARLAWMPDYDLKGNIDIFTYVYTNSEGWKAKFLTSVSVGQWVDAEISINNSKTEYMFVVGDAYTVVEHPHPSLKKLLYPYFGGLDTAYRTMEIYLTKRIF